MTDFKPMEVAGQTTQAIYAGIVKYGADPQLLLEKSGLTLEALKQDSVQKHLKLWEAGEELLSCADIGLQVGSRSSPLERGLLGAVFSSSKNLKTALESAIKYISILVDYIDFEIVNDEKNITVTYSFSKPCFHRYGLEHMSAAFVNWVRVYFNQKISPVSLCYQFEKPPSLPAYKHIFGCPVYFNQPTNTIVLSSRLLYLEKNEYSEYLHTLVSQHADHLMEQRPKNDIFIDKVRAIVSNRLYNGNFSTEDVAMSLNLSKRTYQRRLTDCSYNHHTLVDEVRKSLAFSYLEQPDCQLKNVPYMLGYFDFSGFSRAFKRWSGLTPKAFQKQHVG